MRAIRLFGSGSVLMLLAVVLGLVTAGATLTWLQSQDARVPSTATAETRSREVVVVLEGMLDLWVGDEHYVLHEGDAITYPSRLPHWNVCRQPILFCAMR